jgi:hypothetical protein
MSMEAFDQIRVQDECDDYKLGHSAGACVHEDVCDKDECIQH